MLRNKYLTLALWILAWLALSAIVLKLDGVCMQKFEFSIVPYAWISAALTLLLIYFARKSHAQALKLTLSYLTILPLCIIVGEAFFYYKKLAISSSRLTQPHETLGFANTPKLFIQTPFSVDGKLVYNPTYTHDTYGNRITPNNPESTSCINIYGGSFAYGSGLSDDETLSAFLAQDLPNFHSNNFGIGGAGAHTMLARLEFELDKHELNKCEQNIFIYIIIPHHIYRALGAILGPKYTLDSTGTPHYQGIFTKEAQKPFYKEDYAKPKHFTIQEKLINQLEKSYIVKFISNPSQNYDSKDLLALESYQIGVASHPDINLPIKDTQTYFAIVGRIQALLRARYNAPLYVLVYDYDMHAQFLDKYDSLIQESLAKMGIKFWKMSEILGYEYKQDLARVRRGELESFAYRISRWDTHPNARANEQIASFIAERIRGGSIKASKPTKKEQ